MEIQILNKEALSGIKFTTQEVINDIALKNNLMADLLRAQSLGNLEKIKIKIIFHLEDSSKGIVETTVWGVCEHHLILKGGIHIPIKAIESISIV